MYGHLQEDYYFDIEGTDFILERSSIFTTGDLVKNQYEKLSFILKNYQQIDPHLLESLHYQKPNLQLSELAKYDFKKPENNKN